MIMELLGKIMGWIMHISWCIVPIYPLTVLLFTVITRIILLPVNIWVQKNGIKIVRIQPEINHIKAKFFGDRDRINEETSRIYKREGYHPMASLVPLAIQLVILMGVIEAVKEPSLASMQIEDMICWNVDYYLIPWDAKGWYLLWPVIAGAASWFLCWSQNRDQVLQAEQNNWNKYGLMIFSVCLSLYLGAFVRSGVALYWTYGNIIAVAQTYMLNAWINPKDYINYDALEKSKEELARIDNLDAGVSKKYKKKEKEDYKRFFSILNKHLVVYSEGSGYYKYFESVIEWLLAHSNVIIHYITSDPNDQIFTIKEKERRIKPYYIGQKKLITLFMKMDADVVLMTTPDLEKFYLKRSYVRKDIEYIYIDHGLSSLNLLLREGSLDAFDTVFVSCEQNEKEIVARDKLINKEIQKTPHVGYPYIDDLEKQYNAIKNREFSRKQILIAPSHQTDNILDSCIDKIVDGLLGKEYHIIIRPHPQYIKRYPLNVEKLCEKYKRFSKDEIEIQMDFSSNSTVYESDVLITDWSNIAYEFSFATYKPSIFINTPMKIINPNWKEIGVEPVDFELRANLGKLIELSELDNVAKAVDDIILNPEKYSAKIYSLKQKLLYNVGKAAPEAGKYILNSISQKQKSREV